MLDGTPPCTLLSPASERENRWKMGYSCTNKVAHKTTNAHRNPIKTLLDFKIVTCKHCKSGLGRTVDRAEVVLPESSG